MKTKLKFLLTLLSVLMMQISFAQERTVSGTVTDDTGFPVPGVNVVVKGTSTSTQTDFDGKFQIKATPDQTIVFSYVGMATQEIKASATEVSVKLSSTAQELEGVVVTAMGISRDKKSLGYAAQKVDAAAVNSVPTNNFINNLSGKVAGLQITNNGNFGGSSNIVLRGVKSLTGNNQALIVVDGVPVSNSNQSTANAASGRGGFDFGNSTSDIDPNNIESVTVLKGAAATALYGSQASNGAIMITTKKGKKNTGLGVTFSSTTSVGKFNKSTFAKYQKQYGANGYSGDYNDSFYGADVNGDGVEDLIVDMTADASYGNAFDPTLMVYQWNAFAPGNPNYGKATPWVAAKNDPTKFFENSFGFQNSVNFNGGDDKTIYNFGLTNNYETGILPNSKLSKNIINGSFTRDLTDKIKLTAWTNWSNQSTTGRNSVGYGDNILTGFRQWWETNVDIKELKQEYFRNHQNVTWNMNSPLDGDYSPAYWNNPYWDRYQNYETDEHSRILTGANLSYDIFKDFNVLGRITIDQNTDKQELRKAIGSHAEEFGVSALDETSGYSLYTRNFLQATYDFIASYNFSVGKVGGKAVAGTNFISSKNRTFWGSTTGGLAIPGVYSLANSVSYVGPIENLIYYQKFGVYGQLSLDYDRFLFLEGSYRQDTSSALPTNNNSYGYYSVGGSFLASEFIKKDWLNLLKLRASYAVVGNDPAPGWIDNRTYNGIINGMPLYSNSPTYIDRSILKPEKQHAKEIGLEGSFFNNRLGFDTSFYESNTKDQLFTVPQSAATGYTSSYINAGDLQNRGVEVSLTGTPIQLKDFTWDVKVNWSKNKSKLLRLDGGRDNLQLASFQDGVSLNATVGQPYGTLRGTDFVYLNGQPVVDEDGYYESASDKVIGNITPDWIGGVWNKFTYKNVSLSFLIDVKKGGDLFSLDQSYGQYTGLYNETAGLNDLGNPKRNLIADGGGVILPGVKEDGTPNTSRIEAYYTGSAYGTGAAPAKAFIYDASYVKLRELAVSYSFPKELIDKAKLSALSLSFLGNNLWIIHKNVPYADPESGTTSGNISGFQSGVMPSIKTYSINLKASF